MRREQLTDHAERVRRFMELAGQEVPSEPTIPSAEVRILRAKLILEEAFETVEALGVCVYDEDGYELNTDALDFESAATFSPDLVQIADGCADLSVVGCGTLLACGLADKPILEAVDSANLAKFTGDAHRAPSGKWIKPSDWTPPPIERLIEEQRA